MTCDLISKFDDGPCPVQSDEELDRQLYQMLKSSPGRFYYKQFTDVLYTDIFCAKLFLTDVLKSTKMEIIFNQSFKCQSMSIHTIVLFNYSSVVSE